MKRLAVVAVLFVAAATTAGFAHAAFVAQTQTSQAVGADGIQRWLSLAPADGSTGCHPDPATEVDGTDADLRIQAVAADTTIDCAFIMRARLDGETVTVAPDPAEPGPLASATMATDDRASALAAGDARTVSLTLKSRAGIGRLLVTVHAPGEDDGFLRYAIPVSVTAGGFGAATPPPGGAPVTQPATTQQPSPPQTPATSTDSTTTPPTTTNNPVPSPTVPATPQNKASSRACVSRRVFPLRIRLPRGQRLGRATVRIGRKSMRMRRHSTSLTATVDLRGRAPGTYRVTVMARTRSGRLLRYVRTYRACATRAGAHR